MTEFDHSEANDTAKFRRPLMLIVGMTATVFLVGALTGFAMKVAEDGTATLTSGLILVGLIAATLIAGTLSWKQWQKGSAEPVAPSTRKSRKIYYASMVMGAALGMYIMIVGGGDPSTMFSNEPISSVTAIGAILVWAIGTPAITLLWWKTADEHEKKAYSDGALIAFHAYIFVVPSWWMATRAGWLPQQDPMIVWIVAIVIWSAGWLYRKHA